MAFLTLPNAFSASEPRLNPSPEAFTPTRAKYATITRQYNTAMAIPLPTLRFFISDTTRITGSEISDMTIIGTAGVMNAPSTAKR